MTLLHQKIKKIFHRNTIGISINVFFIIRNTFLLQSSYFGVQNCRNMNMRYRQI